MRLSLSRRQAEEFCKKVLFDLVFECFWLTEKGIPIVINDENDGKWVDNGVDHNGHGCDVSDELMAEVEERGEEVDGDGRDHEENRDYCLQIDKMQW